MNLRILLILTIIGIIPGAASAQNEASQLISKVREKNKLHHELSYWTAQDYQKLRVWSRRDTALLVLIESYFHDSVAGNEVREIELKRKESATLPVQLGRLAYFHPVDLFADVIELPDYRIGGPLGKYGNSDYTFASGADSAGISKVDFHHHGIIFPGINGTLWIERASAKLVHAEFYTNQAVNLGLLRDLHWSEDYEVVDGVNLLHSSELRLVVKTQIGLLPQYHVEISNDMSRYSLITPEQILSKNDVLTPDAFDSLGFIRQRPRRLSVEEYSSYERGSAIINGGSGGAGGALLTGLIDADILQYNRVEGLRVQLHERINEIGDWPLAISALGAYGFGDHRWKYDLSASQGIFWHEEQSVATSIGFNGGLKTSVKTIPIPWLSIGGRLHDDRQLRGTARSVLMNTISALGYKSDFPDYFWSHGFTGFIDYKPYALVDVEVALKNEQQTTIDSTPVTHFSILSSGKAFRPNPPINDGYLRELRATINSNDLPEGFGQGRQFYSRIEVARASASWGSDFDYSTVTVIAAVDLPDQQWGMTTIYFDGSTTLSGALGNQHLFLFETPRGFSNRTRAFLTIKDRQFQGDRIAMLYLEQNMFDLPTRALGIHALEPYDLHWFVFSNIGMSALSEKTQLNLRYPIETTGNVPYAEAGIGIGNIFNILRVDGAWRLTHKDAIGAGFAILATIGLTL